MAYGASVMSGEPAKTPIPAAAAAPVLMGRQMLRLLSGRSNASRAHRAAGRFAGAAPQTNVAFGLTADDVRYAFLAD